MKILFFYENIQCDLSNERKLHQEFKYAIKNYFQLAQKILCAKQDIKLSISEFFQKVPNEIFFNDLIWVPTPLDCTKQKRNLQ